LLGEDAPLSPSTIARLKEQWQGEWEAWRRRRLDDLEPVYLWADGVYVRAGLEQEKAAVLVVVVGCVDGRKVVVSVEPGARESVETWSRVLRDLRDRGLRAPRLVIADGHLGIWGAVRNIWPEVDEQRCWNHKMMNVLDQVPKTQQPAARRMLREVMYAPTASEAERKRQQFEAWAQSRGYRTAAETLARDWERMVTLYRYPREHWVHIRTVNVVESPFAALRLRTDAAKRFKRSDRATAVIWKMLMVGGTPLPPAERAAPAREGLRGRAVRGRSRGYPGGRRLMAKYTPLDGTSQIGMTVLRLNEVSTFLERAFQNIQ